MLKELQKKSNKEEIELIISNNEILLAVLKGLIELKLDKNTFIRQLEESKDWHISLKCNELEYEKLIDVMKDFEIYIVEEDRFVKIFNKRLGD